MLAFYVHYYNNVTQDVNHLCFSFFILYKDLSKVPHKYQMPRETIRGLMALQLTGSGCHFIGLKASNYHCFCTS